MKPVSKIMDRLYCWKRKRRLRLEYEANLRDSTNSAGEKVRFHIEHLRSYWNRCVGFVSCVSPSLPARNDLWTCVRMGTEEAAKDIGELLAQEQAKMLLQRWHEYQLRL